jgi:hypothetical protein
LLCSTSVVASAIYKWNDEPLVDESWSTISDNSETWTVTTH